MRLNYTTAQEAYDYIVKYFGKQDIINIYISELETSGDGYTNLATLLDTTEIKEGFYVYESDEDTTKQQRVYVNIVGADIILNISIDGGSTFTFDEIWDLRKLTDDACIDWGDGTKDSNISHTYSTAFEGTIKIYGYGIIKQKYPSDAYYSDSNTTKGSIISVEFVTPQIIENMNQLFSSCSNLTSVKGHLYLTQTHSTSTLVPMFYGCGSLTSLKDFIIYTTETAPNSLRCAFQNCSSLTDETIKQMKFVKLNPDNITNYKKAFVATQITKVPSKLFGKKGVDYDNCFEGCKNLKHIPSGILENCTTAYGAFMNSGVTSVADDFTLPNLIKGGCMFSACKLPWETVVKIYNALPTISTDAAPTQPTSREENSEYTIVFGFIDGEETKI